MYQALLVPDWTCPASFRRQSVTRQLSSEAQTPKTTQSLRWHTNCCGTLHEQDLFSVFNPIADLYTYYIC